MDPMFLKDVESNRNGGGYGALARGMEAQGIPVPQIFHLFSFKPSVTEHLARFTHEVMRGPSPLPAGTRELIAAFTSRRNDCPF